MSHSLESLNRDILLLHREIARLDKVVGTLITWIAQSAASPLSVKDAEELIAMLGGSDDRP